MPLPTTAMEALCFPVFYLSVHPSFDIYSTWCDISTWWMDFSDTCHKYSHVSGHCWKIFNIRGQRSKSLFLIIVCALYCYHSQSPEDAISCAQMCEFYYGRCTHFHTVASRITCSAHALHRHGQKCVLILRLQSPRFLLADSTFRFWQFCTQQLVLAFVGRDRLLVHVKRNLVCFRIADAFTVITHTQAFAGQLVDTQTNATMISHWTCTNTSLLISSNSTGTSFSITSP